MKIRTAFTFIKTKKRKKKYDSKSHILVQVLLKPCSGTVPGKSIQSNCIKRYKMLHPGKSIQSASSTGFENTENFPYLPKAEGLSSLSFPVPNHPTAVFLNTVE